MSACTAWSGGGTSTTRGASKCVMNALMHESTSWLGGSHKPVKTAPRFSRVTLCALSTSARGPMSEGLRTETNA